MKFLLVLLCLVVLRPATQALAAPGSTAPADTVAGHARMVRKLSEAMCAQLANDHTTNFEAMATPAALQMTQEMFITAMKRDSVAFIAMITTASEQGRSAQSVGQEVGKDVVLRLSKSCPAALPLILRLSQTEQAKQAVTAKVPPISETEKKALLPLASHICVQLAAAETRQPFAKLLPEQRKALFTTLMQKEFITNRAGLLRYYSAAQLSDPQRREEIGQKMAALMLQQNDCTKYLLLVGVDEISKKP